MFSNKTYYIYNIGCIVNPGCYIIAEKDAGPIIFGDYNIIEVYISKIY